MAGEYSSRGLFGGATEAVVDSFPVRSFGRSVDCNPVAAVSVGLVELVVEGGSVFDGSRGHPNDRDVGSARRAFTLQVDSLAVVRHFPIFH